MKPADTTLLHLDLHVGDWVKIGNNIAIRLEHKSGRVAKLAIEAPRGEKVELQESMKQG